MSIVQKIFYLSDAYAATKNRGMGPPLFSQQTFFIYLPIENSILKPFVFRFFGKCKTYEKISKNNIIIEVLGTSHHTLIILPLSKTMLRACNVYFLHITWFTSTCFFVFRYSIKEWLIKLFNDMYKELCTQSRKLQSNQLKSK